MDQPAGTPKESAHGEDHIGGRRSGQLHCPQREDEQENCNKQSCGESDQVACEEGPSRGSAMHLAHRIPKNIDARDGRTAIRPRRRETIIERRLVVTSDFGLPARIRTLTVYRACVSQPFGNRYN
jgi:hypothetical protein